MENVPIEQQQKPVLFSTRMLLFMTERSPLCTHSEEKNTIVMATLATVKVIQVLYVELMYIV